MPSSLAGFLGAGCSPLLPPRNTQDRTAAGRTGEARDPGGLGPSLMVKMKMGQDGCQFQACVCFGLTAPKVEPKVPQEGKLSLQVGDCRAGIPRSDLAISNPLIVSPAFAQW